MTPLEALWILARGRWRACRRAIARWHVALARWHIARAEALAPEPDG